MPGRQQRRAVQNPAAAKKPPGALTVDASAFNDRLTIGTVETICTHRLKI
jgi:hypothetical protein